MGSAGLVAQLGLGGLRVAKTTVAILAELSLILTPIDC